MVVETLWFGFALAFPLSQWLGTLGSYWVNYDFWILSEFQLLKHFYKLVTPSTLANPPKDV